MQLATILFVRRQSIILDDCSFEFIRENFDCIRRGVGWVPPVMLISEVIGPDRMMYAMGYLF